MNLGRHDLISLDSTSTCERDAVEITLYLDTNRPAEEAAYEMRVEHSYRVVALVSCIVPRTHRVGYKGGDDLYQSRLPALWVVGFYEAHEV